MMLPASSLLTHFYINMIVLHSSSLLCCNFTMIICFLCRSDASAALQVRALKDYCNNYDLTSLNIKAGDVITVKQLFLSEARGFSVMVYCVHWRLMNFLKSCKFVRQNFVFHNNMIETSCWSFITVLCKLLILEVQIGGYISTEAWKVHEYSSLKNINSPLRVAGYQGQLQYC